MPSKQITFINVTTNQEIAPTVPTYTVSDIVPATIVGQLAYISNEVGGATIAFSDGTNWRRISDRAIIVSA